MACAAVALAVGVVCVDRAEGAGARSFKSGPIQITADGTRVWVVNPDHDSVSRIDTSTDAVVEFPLPQPAGPPERHNPTGLSVMEDGSEVWVACHDSDRIYVLRGSDGAVLARIDLPWGTGPYGVALSRDQSQALVTLLRGSRVAVVDRPSRRVVATLDTFRSPFGIAWLEDGVSAWITHRHVLDRLPRVSRVEVSPPGPRVTTVERTDGAGPQDNAALHDADPSHNVAEGGYLNFRGQLAQRPGTTRVWVPTQYDNRNQTIVTPDSIIQATLRQIDLGTRRIPGTIGDKIIPSAKQVHDPQTAAWIGPGWDLGFSGPDDVAFTSDGAVVYVVGEMSQNLLVMPATTPPYRDGIAPSPVLVGVGARPQGVAIAPVATAGRWLATWPTSCRATSRRWTSPPGRRRSRWPACRSPPPHRSHAPRRSSTGTGSFTPRPTPASPRAARSPAGRATSTPSRTAGPGTCSTCPGRTGRASRSRSSASDCRWGRATRSPGSGSCTA